MYNSYKVCYRKIIGSYRQNLKMFLNEIDNICNVVLLKKWFQEYVEVLWVRPKLLFRTVKNKVFITGLFE